MQKRLPKSLVSEYSTIYFSKDSVEEKKRFVIREVKYNILINGKKFTSVMLLPDKLKEFAYGFLYTSSIIEKAEDIIHFRVCNENNMHIYLSDIHFNIATKMQWTVTSGCGGGKVLENTYKTTEKVDTSFTTTFEKIIDLFEKLEEDSFLYAQTRCAHKAFFKSNDNFHFTCEDIGRHNTIDKCIGAVLLNNSSFDCGIILTTGRLTSEMILKCVKAKIPIVVSRTAPSEEGINIAKNAGITLVGLTSKKGFTVFSHIDRIKHSSNL